MATGPPANSSEINVDLLGRVMSLTEVYNEAQMVGARCAAAACVLTARSICLQLQHNGCRRIRCHIISILLLVPVYAVDAWVGLYRSRFTGLSLQLLRQIYEAYALLSFMLLVFECFGGTASMAKRLDVHKRSSCCGLTGRSGLSFARGVRLGVWQYIVICGLLLPMLSLWTWEAGRFHEGLFTYRDAYPYCAAVQFASQCWALACLMELLRRSHEDLAPVRPVLKFLCVKLIIFFTWLQSLAIQVLENLSSLGQVSLWIETEKRTTISHWWDPCHWFDKTQVHKTWTDEWQRADVRCHVGSGLGSLLLCIEMVGFALLHCWAYPGSEWDLSQPDCAAYKLQQVLKSNGQAGSTSREEEQGLAGSREGREPLLEDIGGPPDAALLDKDGTREEEGPG